MIQDTVNQITYLDTLKLQLDENSRMILESDIRHNEYSKLAFHVYEINQPSPPGWICVNFKEEDFSYIQPYLKQGIILTYHELYSHLHLYDFDNFIQASIYVPVRKIWRDNFSKPVLVFKGTSSNCIRYQWGTCLRAPSNEVLINDLKADIVQAFGLPDKTYENALEIALFFNDILVDFDVVGHSLGGGLASLVWSFTGKEALIINSAGLSPDTTQWLLQKHHLRRPINPKPIISINIDKEVLTSFQDGLNDFLSNKQNQNLLQKPFGVIEHFGQRIQQLIPSKVIDCVVPSKLISSVTKTLSCLSMPGFNLTIPKAIGTRMVYYSYIPNAIAEKKNIRKCAVTFKTILKEIKKIVECWIDFMEYNPPNLLTLIEISTKNSPITFLKEIFETIKLPIRKIIRVSARILFAIRLIKRLYYLISDLKEICSRHRISEVLNTTDAIIKKWLSIELIHPTPNNLIRTIILPDQKEQILNMDISSLSIICKPLIGFLSGPTSLSHCYVFLSNDPLAERGVSVDFGNFYLQDNRIFGRHKVYFFNDDAESGGARFLYIKKSELMRILGKDSFEVPCEINGIIPYSIGLIFDILGLNDWPARKHNLIKCNSATFAAKFISILKAKRKNAKISSYLYSKIPTPVMTELGFNEHPWLYSATKITELVVSIAV